MTEHDVIDTLRRHRPEDLPDEVVSPHAPAAEALLEEILSMQTIESRGDGGRRPRRLRCPLRPHRRRSRRAVTVAGAAAAAVAAVVAAASVVLRPAGAVPGERRWTPPSHGPSRRSTSPAGRRSRCRGVRRRAGRPGVRPGTGRHVGVRRRRFVGHPHHYRIDGIDAIPGDVDPINRRIDGEFYLLLRCPATTRTTGTTIPGCAGPRTMRSGPTRRRCSTSSGLPASSRPSAPGGRRGRDPPAPRLPARRHARRCPPRELGAAR